MLRKIVLGLAVIGFILSCTQAWAQDPKKKKEPRYSVLMVTAMDLTVKFQLLDDKIVTDFKRDLDKEYKEAVKEWERAKKEAKKNKEKFEQPKPNKPKVKVLKKGLKKDKAEEYKLEAEEEYRKKMEKESEKKTPPKRKRK